MYKFFLNSEDLMEQDLLIIKNKESVQHLVRSLRIQIGEQVTFCGEGVNFVCEIVEFSTEEIRAKCLEKVMPDHESPLKIDIFQCLPKGQKLELIIQKNVELGVRDFYLVESKRCIVDYKSKDVSKKIERLDKIALEAAKQSKRDYISKVKDIIPLKAFEKHIHQYDMAIVLYEGETTNYLNHVIEGFKGTSIAVLIGPEGGFDLSEIEMLKNQGVQIVTLGKRILRTETAGFTCVSCLQYAIGDLSS